MQQIDLNQTIFSLSLGGTFIFGILFASLVHWASKKNWVGQTAFAVVLGVAGTLLLMIPVFGLDRVAVMFSYFAASGIPMIFEYLQRIQKEIQEDNEKAKELAKDIVNDRQTGDR